jgi:uncharacterized membrane protein
VEKKNVEDLSNLMFGLALTLGALTLVKPLHDDFGELLRTLLQFALSFFVIIWIWSVYNFTVAKVETTWRPLFALNIALLFLIVIEPFLLSISGTVAGAAVYAMDLGTTMIILLLLNEALLRQIPSGDEAEVARLKRNRLSLLIGGTVFFASIIPGFIPELRSQGVQSLMWLAVLVFAVIFRSSRPYPRK